jgi:hypothetical protein
MKFDLNSLNKYMSPQAMGDLNKLLEEMPIRAGYGVLIAAAVVWLFAGLAVVYATTVAKDVAEIRAELVKSEALQPVVPNLVEEPVPDAEIVKFTERTDPLYKNVSLAANGGVITVQSNSGRYFGAFREAINHAYNGGQGWRLALQSLCVGRECEKGVFLKGEFKVNRLRVQR